MWGKEGNCPLHAARRPCAAARPPLSSSMRILSVPCCGVRVAQYFLTRNYYANISWPFVDIVAPVSCALTVYSRHSEVLACIISFHPHHEEREGLHHLL